MVTISGNLLLFSWFIYCYSACFATESPWAVYQDNHDFVSEDVSSIVGGVVGGSASTSSSVSSSSSSEEEEVEDVSQKFNSRGSVGESHLPRLAGSIGELSRDENLLPSTPDGTSPLSPSGSSREGGNERGCTSLLQEPDRTPSPPFMSQDYSQQGELKCSQKSDISLDGGYKSSSCCHPVINNDKHLLLSGNLLSRRNYIGDKSLLLFVKLVSGFSGESFFDLGTNKALGPLILSEEQIYDKDYKMIDLRVAIAAVLGVEIPSSLELFYENGQRITMFDDEKDGKFIRDDDVEMSRVETLLEHSKKIEEVEESLEINAVDDENVEKCSPAPRNDLGAKDSGEKFEITLRVVRKQAPVHPLIVLVLESFGDLIRDQRPHTFDDLLDLLWEAINDFGSGMRKLEASETSYSSSNRDAPFFLVSSKNSLRESFITKSGRLLSDPNEGMKVFDSGGVQKLFKDYTGSMGMSLELFVNLDRLQDRKMSSSEFSELITPGSMKKSFFTIDIGIDFYNNRLPTWDEMFFECSFRELYLHSGNNSFGRSSGYSRRSLGYRRGNRSSEPPPGREGGAGPGGRRRWGSIEWMKFSCGEAGKWEGDVLWESGNGIGVDINFCWNEDIFV